MRRIHNAIFMVSGNSHWLLTSLLLVTIGCADMVAEHEQTAAFKSDPPLGKADSVLQQAPRPEFDTERCAYDVEDPHEPRARFQKGPWQGECLDTKNQRPVVVLDTPYQGSDILKLGNVSHDDGFWIAEIPTDAVQNVYFQLEYFPAVVPAGHTQLRIEFSEPVVMVGQSQWNRGQITELYNLVMSAEAVTRVGDQYDLFTGMQDHFGLALRVTSLEDRYQSMVVEKNHHVEQWRLQLTDQEKSEMMVFYAYESEALGLDLTYHTLFRNCTTELIRSIDGVVTYTVGENIKRFLTKVTEIYPNIVRAGLIARGLLPLDQSTDWYPLEDDPSYPASH